MPFVSAQGSSSFDLSPLGQSIPETGRFLNSEKPSLFCHSSDRRYHRSGFWKVCAATSEKWTDTAAAESEHEVCRAARRAYAPLVSGEQRQGGVGVPKQRSPPSSLRRLRIGSPLFHSVRCNS